MAWTFEQIAQKGGSLGTHRARQQRYEPAAQVSLLDDRFHETTQLHLWLSIHGMRPFRASHMIRTLKTLD
jgi:hypothetical protein